MGRHHERQAEDWYRTPPQVTRALLTREKFTIRGLPDMVHEPACGDGAISEVLQAWGYHTHSADLMDRGYGYTGVNFLDENFRRAPCLVTNPPYNLANEFFLHANELGYEKIALLLRLAWLEGEARRSSIFENHPPARIHVFSGRQTLWKGDDPAARATGGMAAYAWFVWEKRFSGKPTISWIPAAETARKTP